MNEKLRKSRINQYAAKFLADNRRKTPVTNEVLERTFKNCVIPAKMEMYEEIKIRINEMRNDPNYKLYDEE